MTNISKSVFSTALAFAISATSLPAFSQTAESGFLKISSLDKGATYLVQDCTGLPSDLNTTCAPLTTVTEKQMTVLRKQLGRQILEHRAMLVLTGVGGAAVGIVVVAGAAAVAVPASAGATFASAVAVVVGAGTAGLASMAAGAKLAIATVKKYFMRSQKPVIAMQTEAQINEAMSGLGTLTFLNSDPATARLREILVSKSAK